MSGRLPCWALRYSSFSSSFVFRFRQRRIKTSAHEAGVLIFRYQIFRGIPQSVMASLNVFPLPAPLGEMSWFTGEVDSSSGASDRTDQASLQIAQGLLDESLLSRGEQVRVHVSQAKGRLNGDSPLPADQAGPGSLNLHFDARGTQIGRSIRGGPGRHALHLS